MTPAQRSHLITKKEDGTRRFREIQEYLSRGLTKDEVAQKLKIQIASLERTLERAKRKGLDL
jgi:DNA-binding transcriptional regulator LsrR (DeoR family)